MGFKIPLGRIAGISVDTDPTVPVLALLYTVTLAAGRFPVEHPGLPAAVYWGAGAAGALLFFASLLVHELAHALVAEEEGIGVRGISLWFLGGMARLESSPRTAAAEFRIAVVGPLASAACGVVLLCAAYLLGDGGVAGLLADLFRLLGLLNLLLAGFNLLPAAPLDGGTVLAALIWRRTGSQAHGRRITAFLGFVIAAIMIHRGLLWIRSGDPGAINGWAVLIVASFIAMSALRNLRSGPLLDLLDGLTIDDAVRPVSTVAIGSWPLTRFLATLDPRDESDAFPVVDDHGEFVGLLTIEAIRAVDHTVREQLLVGQLAFGFDRLVIVRRGEPMLTVLQRVGRRTFVRGVVVDEDHRVVGTFDARSVDRAVERRRVNGSTPPDAAATLRT